MTGRDRVGLNERKKKRYGRRKGEVGKVLMGGEGGKVGEV